jgi:hypothetical protein
MKHNQSGLSLIAVAIIMACLAAAAMAALYAIRYDKNPITELLKSKGAGDTINQTQQALDKAKSDLTGKPTAAAAAAESGAIRKCIIDGKTVFSNTDCPKNSQKLKLHDTAGFAPPRKPVDESASGEASATLQQKAMEKAIEKATR